MGPQAPVSNPIPPSATVTARRQVQTNKFFSLDAPVPARVEKQPPPAPSKKTKGEDEDDLPLLVGEKVSAKTTSGAVGTTNLAPATPLPKTPTVKTATGTVTIEDADEEDNVESESSLLSHRLFLRLTMASYCR